MSISLDLLNKLNSLTTAKKLLVAYSGGLDSHVLLHALVAINSSQTLQIRAIYIDHGLQEAAKPWSQHCLNICSSLDVNCEIASLNLIVPKGKSVEAVAREARYQMFSQRLQQDEVLVTAHHQDDQAETLLIQLFRGAGVNGLAAMPVMSRFASGQHIRPLLGQSRQSLEQYAQQHKLETIEDPSNQNQCFDRNFLRHDIVPRLKNRWKSINSLLARAAQHQAEAKILFAEYLEQDLPQLAGKRSGTLSIQKLKQLSVPRCKAIIRYFLDQKGFLAPSEKKLRHILSDVLNAGQSAMPFVHWQGIEVRRFQDDLYAIEPLKMHNTEQIIHWNTNQSLQLPYLKRILKIDHLVSINDLLVKHHYRVEIRFRQGGEKIYQVQRKRTKSLKKIFQERHIPTWERDRIPLVYIDNTLVFILF
ncbi:MAG: tRNA lysidine(34) synthetase TilS [Cocleimonas sp.]|nr:tRNA lysidine(34) synthetase TilS [Cocleimonas sp.]